MYAENEFPTPDRSRYYRALPCQLQIRRPAGIPEANELPHSAFRDPGRKIAADTLRASETLRVSDQQTRSPAKMGGWAPTARSGRRRDGPALRDSAPSPPRALCLGCVEAVSNLGRGGSCGRQRRGGWPDRGAFSSAVVRGCNLGDRGLRQKQGTRHAPKQLPVAIFGEAGAARGEAGPRSLFEPRVLNAKPAESYPRTIISDVQEARTR
jgi:hypothetical protein